MDPGSKKYESCGFGKKRINRFGSEYTTFFQNGSNTNTFLTPEIKKCLSTVYLNEDAGYRSSSFGSLKLKEINNYIKYLQR